MSDEPVIEVVVGGPDIEQEVAEALAGPVVDMEPVCPLCGHMGGNRLQEHLETGERFKTPCYLSWCAAGGVLAPYRRDAADKPPFQMIPDPERGGSISAYRTVGVECGDCGYVSHPSAFCRPTGPPVAAEAKLY